MGRTLFFFLVQAPIASALDILIVFGHLPIDRTHPFRARRSLDAAARRIRGGTSVVSPPSFRGTPTPPGLLGMTGEAPRNGR